MIGDLRTREALAIFAVLGAGLAGTAVAVGGRSSDTQFLRDQRHPPVLQARAVERVVRTAPDPRTGKGAGIAAECVRKGSGRIGNPWACVVSYEGGRRVRLSVRVSDDGAYLGRYAGGGGAAEGCCIDIPGSE